jgi:hypothetical protein
MEPAPVPWSLRYPVGATALGSFAGAVLVAALVALGGGSTGDIAFTAALGTGVFFALFALASLWLRRPVLPLLLSGGSLGRMRRYGGEGGGDGETSWTEVHSADHWVGGDFGGAGDGGGGDGGGG